MQVAASEIAIGLACIVLGCAGFWFLLPRHDKIHPLVLRWDGGSSLTLGIMFVVTMGIALVIAGIFE
jgi:hypothetical protein